MANQNCKSCGKEFFLLGAKEVNIPNDFGGNIAYACPSCGRLHWVEGYGVTEDIGITELFLVNGGIERRSMT